MKQTIHRILCIATLSAILLLGLDLLAWAWHRCHIYFVFGLK